MVQSEPQTLRHRRAGQSLSCGPIPKKLGREGGRGRRRIKKKVSGSQQTAAWLGRRRGARGCSFVGASLGRGAGEGAAAPARPGLRCEGDLTAAALRRRGAAGRPPASRPSAGSPAPRPARRASPGQTWRAWGRGATCNLAALPFGKGGHGK